MPGRRGGGGEDRGWIGWVAAVAVLGLSVALRREAGFTIRPAHFAERHQLLIIIALGETVVATGVGAQDHITDTAVLEAVFLRGALHMTEDDISHLRGLDYSKSLDDAIERVESGLADAGFFMRATPVEQVQEVAATGESMPPKSTYFYPKVPTGLVFNPLET